MPELHGTSSFERPILARSALHSQRDLKLAIYSPLLYSVNCICVGCKRHVRSIRQEEIFISDGQGLRRSRNH